MWAAIAQAVLGSTVANAILGIPEANAPGHGDEVPGLVSNSNDHHESDARDSGKDHDSRDSDWGNPDSVGGHDSGDSDGGE